MVINMDEQAIEIAPGQGVDTSPQDGRLTSVKLLLGIPGTAHDEILSLVLDTTLDTILRYINQDTLPDPLENILISMAVSYYKAAGLGNTAPAVGPVSSVKRGDVSTSFVSVSGFARVSGASGSSQTFNLGNDDGDFFGWKTVLNEYRRVRW